MNCSGSRASWIASMRAMASSRRFGGIRVSSSSSSSSRDIPGVRMCSLSLSLSFIYILQVLFCFFLIRAAETVVSVRGRKRVCLSHPPCFNMIP